MSRGSPPALEPAQVPFQLGQLVAQWRGCWWYWQCRFYVPLVPPDDWMRANGRLPPYLRLWFRDFHFEQASENGPFQLRCRACHPCRCGGGENGSEPELPCRRYGRYGFGCGEVSESRPFPLWHHSCCPCSRGGEGRLLCPCPSYCSPCLRCSRDCEGNESAAKCLLPLSCFPCHPVGGGSVTST